MMTDFDTLYARAEAIQERRANGYWEPIFWHLALRGHSLSRLRLADWYSRQGTKVELGRFGDGYSPLGLMYSAYRKGESFAGTNLAISYFNIGDMAGYRYWLAKAAKPAEPGAKEELKLFETRKPHRLARRLKRLRPLKRDGS